MRFAFFALAASLAAACGTMPNDPSAGATTARDVEHTFLALDENRDGVLTPSEAVEAPTLARRFESADANGDGVLQRYEYNSPAWRPMPHEPD